MLLLSNIIRHAGYWLTPPSGNSVEIWIPLTTSRRSYIKHITRINTMMMSNRTTPVRLSVSGLWRIFPLILLVLWSN